MATIFEQYQRAKLLSKENIINEIFDFIRSIEVEILDISRNRLRNQSKDIFGQPIGFYSYATEIITKGAKRKGEPFDAYDTGKLLNGLTLKQSGDRFEFFTTDNKIFEIQKSRFWLSKELFGLSDIELKDLILQKILPDIQLHIRSTLNV